MPLLVSVGFSLNFGKSYLPRNKYDWFRAKICIYLIMIKHFVYLNIDRFSERGC